MEVSEIVILAVVQGLTEFLPISSSGHLVMARALLDITDIEGSAFDAFLHLGTLLAVLVYYWRVWAGLLRGLVASDAEGRDKRNLAAKLAVATVPAAVAGYLARDAVGTLLRSPQTVAGGLLLTGGVLLVVDVMAKRTTARRASFYDAWLIGLVQAVALVPGISRSGVTIAAGRARGLSRKQATTFSFLLSAPIIAGAGLASLSSLAGNDSFAVWQLLTGFMVSFGAGLVAIWALLRLVERVTFWPFVVYLFLLSGLMFYVG